MISLPPAQSPSGAAPLHAADDHALLVDLLGPAAARLIDQMPVATLLDAGSAQLAAFGLQPGVRRRLLAAAELARRFQPSVTPPEPLTQPRHFLPHLTGLRTNPVEVLGVLLLDARLSLLKPFHSVAGGGVMHISVTPREVFAEAVALRTAGLVLAHNHPSGDPHPSAEDRVFTQLMVKAGALLSIRVLDHIILARRGYFSFAEARLL